jgi:acetylornithine deacetylase/succinyl-diaminopimelate desuccinylase-like protein
VLGGLEALRILRETGFEPKRRFGLLRSWTRRVRGLERPFSAAVPSSATISGPFVSAGMRRSARRWQPAATTSTALAQARAIDQVDAYIELHIEQGPVLEAEGADIGVVTGIVGLLGVRARYVGKANHAGTTPMNMRRDALVGAARTVIALRDMARTRGDLTANFGFIVAEPGGSNVVPGACEFTIDVRSLDESTFGRLPVIAREILERIAGEESLGST